jgi:hypothetical protein
MNWWRTDPAYGGPAVPSVSEMSLLTEKIDQLASKIESLEQKQNLITRTNAEK